MRRFAPRTARKLFNSSLSLTAYPSYQVPFRERRVPFLLVKFHYIFAETESLCQVSLIFQIYNMLLSFIHLHQKVWQHNISLLFLLQSKKRNKRLWNVCNENHFV